jgi:hypothetical protein
MDWKGGVKSDCGTYKVVVFHRNESLNPFFLQFYNNVVKLFCIQISSVRLQYHTLLLFVVRLRLIFFSIFLPLQR